MPEPRFAIAPLASRIAAAVVATVLAVATGLLGLAGAASAHPHIWVRVRATVLYENGAIVAIRHAWTFDEYYTAMAIEGLDANKDGIYAREELAELAKVNIDALKEFGYFTFPRLKDQELVVGVPKDYYLEHVVRAPDPSAPAKPAAEPVLPRTGADQIADAAKGPAKELTLNFTLPLAKPVLADAEGFSFSMGDPTFFIAFEPAGENAVALAGAPKGCSVTSAQSAAPDANASKPGDLMASKPSDLSVNIVSGPAWQVTCGPAG